MLSRAVRPLLESRLAAAPAAALVGPRQVGKTTLARMLGGEYYDLEQEPDRLRLDLDWDRVVAEDTLLLLDEAQEFPEIFPRLRGAIDADRGRNGRFLILGSIAPSLMHRVSESLAGRLALVQLSPFNCRELSPEQLEDLWLHGGYPAAGATAPERYPDWQLDYHELLTQRDLPHWGLAAKPAVSRRLMQMLCAVHGQLQNASDLARSLGLSSPTITQYLDFLEGVFLVRRLPAYSKNIRKRLVKSPRLYWRDSGLLHAQSGVSDRETLLSQPWVGASWEGFVLEQILSTCEQLGLRVQPYHFRSSDGYEIDLVLDWGVESWAIETKLTSRPSRSDLERLEKTAGLIDADRRFLVSRTAEDVISDESSSCSLAGIIGCLEERA